MVQEVCILPFEIRNLLHLISDKAIDALPDKFSETDLYSAKTDLSQNPNFFADIHRVKAEEGLLKHTELDSFINCLWVALRQAQTIPMVGRRYTLAEIEMTKLFNSIVALLKADMDTGEPCSKAGQLLDNAVNGTQARAMARLIAFVLVVIENEIDVQLQKMLSSAA